MSLILLVILYLFDFIIFLSSDVDCLNAIASSGSLTIKGKADLHRLFFNDLFFNQRYF